MAKIPAGMIAPPGKAKLSAAAKTGPMSAGLTKAAAAGGAKKPMPKKPMGVTKGSPPGIAGGAARKGK